MFKMTTSCVVSYEKIKLHFRLPLVATEPRLPTERS